MTGSDGRIEEISRAAEALIAGPPDFLRAFPGDENGFRQQRRSIVIASLRDQEMQGRVGVSVDELASDLESVLLHRNQPVPDDPRADVVEILRQLEGWQAVDGGLAPDRAERDGLRRRVERDYALARPMRVFLPQWDEVQRALRRRYISLSANYFAQAIAALDTLLAELGYEDTDPLRCHSAWQSLRQALHGINTESRDFARELRSLRVDGNHPEQLADIADRLGILHEKFFRVASEGAAKVRERLEQLRDERHDGENVAQLKQALRIREEEWSVGLGETEQERQERLDTIERDVERELDIFERFMMDSGPGSWREGAKVISLALVDLTERIHAAISLRLQQTQAVSALLRRAQALAEGGDEQVQSARRYLWDASGAVRLLMWVQSPPSSEEGVILERWLEHRGGSPLPLVDEDIWQKSIRPRHRAAPPPPPPALVTPENWDPGEDLALKEQEEARQRLVEKLIAAGSAAGLGQLESLAELRLLASFLWLPRDSAPLRRLGLRIQAPGAGMARLAVLRGPGFEVELDNYRFTATNAARQELAEKQRRGSEAAAQLSAIANGEDEATQRLPRMAASGERVPVPVGARGYALEGGDDGGFVTTPLPAVTLGQSSHRPSVPAPAAQQTWSNPDGALPTRPLPESAPHPTQPLDSAFATTPLAPAHADPAYGKQEPQRQQPEQAGNSKRLWPLSGVFGRRGGHQPQQGRE